MKVDPGDAGSHIYRVVPAVQMGRNSIDVAHGQFLQLNSFSRLGVPVEGNWLRHRPADFLLPFRIGYFGDRESDEFGVGATSARGCDAREAGVGNRDRVERISVRHCSEVWMRSNVCSSVDAIS